jgi:hypothetical protein
MIVGQGALALEEQAVPVICPYTYDDQFFFVSTSQGRVPPANASALCASIGLGWANVTREQLPYLWMLQVKCYGPNAYGWLQNYAGLVSIANYWNLNHEYVESTHYYDSFTGVAICQRPVPATVTVDDVYTYVNYTLITESTTVTSTLIVPTGVTTYVGSVSTLTITKGSVSYTTVHALTTEYVRPPPHPYLLHANYPDKRRDQLKKKLPLKQQSGSKRATQWNVCPHSVNNYYVLQYEGENVSTFPDQTCKQVLGEDYDVANLTLPILQNLGGLLNECEVDYVNIGFWYQYQGLCSYVVNNPLVIGFLDFDAPNLGSDCLYAPYVLCYQALGANVSVTSIVPTGPYETVTETDVLETTETETETTTNLGVLLTTSTQTSVIDTFTLVATVTTSVTTATSTSTATSYCVVCSTGCSLTTTVVTEYIPQVTHRCDHCPH